MQHYADLSAFDETLGGQANMRPEVDEEEEEDSRHQQGRASRQQKVFFNLISFFLHISQFLCFTFFLLLMKLKIIKRSRRVRGGEGKINKSN